MEQKKMKIEYRKQIDSETAPWQLLTNVDELLWNGVYALRVTADDGSHKLPFRLADDDTVTIVVKDHAHDGMLENGRTVVQTVTRVDRATGNVLVYTRTRYNAGGTHSWSYWTLAGEGSTAVEIPTASTTSLGAVIVGNGLAVDADGKLSLAAASVGKEQLTADLGVQIDSMAEKLRFAGSLTVNDGTLLHIGALVENSTPYSGTNFCAYTDMLLSNGEQLVVNEGYLISAYKVFEGEQEIAFIGNQNLTYFSLDGEHLNYQLEFKKSDTTAFVASELPRVIKNFQRNPIVWSAGSHIDDYIAPGTYNIRGDRTNLADGLPIYNTGSFSARLTVLATHNCVTQVLTLLNVGGGDCNVYTRTKQGGNWGTWSKLQQNVEVGETTSLDAYIDNGIYSGVYTNGTTRFETFVMVVINNYSVAAATGTARNITQLKYAVDTNGAFSCHARTGQGSDNVEWGEWRDLDAVTTDRIQDGAVTAQKLSAAVAAQINNNTAAIVAERTRAMGQEGLLSSAFEAEKQRAVQAEADAIEKGKQLALRSLFVAAGAEYNDSGADKTKTAPWGETVTHKAGHYYLNGLGDITEEQMMSIFIVSYPYYCATNMPDAYRINSGLERRLRTNLRTDNDFPLSYTNNLARICYGNSSIEVLKICKSTLETKNEVDIEYAFHKCEKLKHVIGIIKAIKTNSHTTFSQCANLISIELKNLKENIIYKDSPFISNTSVLYMIQNAMPISAITITLHPDAYARLADDAEIVAALEAQPLVSLVSA